MNAPLTTFGPIKAVIFDMDGLLLDTEGIYTEVTSLIAGRYGKTFDWSVKQNIIGRGANDLAKYVVQALELPITPEEFLQIREPLMRERFPKAQAMPGAEALVRHLKAHNIPIAVGTSRSGRKPPCTVSGLRCSISSSRRTIRKLARPNRRRISFSPLPGVWASRPRIVWCSRIRRSASPPRKRQA